MRLPPSCARELGGLAGQVDDAEARRNAATVSGIVSLARDDVAGGVRDLREALQLARESRPAVAAGHVAAQPRHREDRCAERPLRRGP